MSRYEYRFVVDGRVNEDGEVEFSVDWEGLDETVWDTEEQEWYSWAGDVDAEDEYEEVTEQLVMRLNP